MKLLVKRIYKGNKYTIGKLYIDGEYFCDTMEPPYRKEKPRAIPTGQYKVIVNYSNRFKRQLPLLLNVEGFEGIRIHNGSYPKDTLGCILVGLNKIKGMLTESRITLNKLLERLKDTNNIQISIVD